MSSAPNCFAMLSRTARVAAKSRTSQLNPNAPAPIKAAALAAFSGLRPATATRAPNSANRLAMPRLMPLVPPAMNAVLPANKFSLNALMLRILPPSCTHRYSERAMMTFMISVEPP